MSSDRPPLFKAYLALTVVCVVWGTTYLAIRIGVETFPPFLFSSIRQMLAGLLILGGIVLFGRFKLPSKRDTLILMLSGFLLITIGNGVVGWAERYIPSGLAALICAIMPVYVVLMNVYIKGYRKELNLLISSGIAFGAIGVVLIFRDNVSDLGNPDYLHGILATFAAAFSWAAGSVLLKQKPVKSDPFMNAAIQLFSGGFLMLVPSLLFDNYAELSDISISSIWAMIYLILAGSILAFLCFLYAIEHLPVGLVSIYGYINPVIAIVLGWLILQERISWLTFFAILFTIAGVYCMNRGYLLQISKLHKPKP